MRDGRITRHTPGPLTDLELTAALAGPIDSQAVVHQATGMVTIQLGISLAEALQRLRAHAYATGRTVSTVAADVVNRRLYFDDGESGTTRQDWS